MSERFWLEIFIRGILYFCNYNNSAEKRQKWSAETVNTVSIGLIAMNAVDIDRIQSSGEFSR